ncbi:SatD family protein [Abyssisolibacter fermentans]|uniref:SatD family protein n=1 Tax=Abyssisolibacter fermentans TaxID=1766203 RepID=UPI00082C80DA|nr:SatD family protein [Abyssisolibacter fermentans]
MLYSVINIDIVGSRKLVNRKIIQEKINYYISYMNKEYIDLLLSPITITLGDEWQIILKTPSKSYRIIDKFQELLREDNIKIYAGIGLGKLSTKVYKDIRLMDGECFINARKALNIVKNKNTFYNHFINTKKNRIYFCGEIETFIEKNDKYSINLDEIAATSDMIGTDDNFSINALINALIENTEVLKNNITNKQQEIINLYKKYGSYNNIIKGNNLLTKSSISQKLNDSNFFVINKNNLIIELLIEYYCKIREDS